LSKSIDFRNTQTLSANSLTESRDNLKEKKNQLNIAQSIERNQKQGRIEMRRNSLNSENYNRKYEYEIYFILLIKF
jgi:hypothetical protein